MQDEPILTDRPFDSHNIAFWDAEREEYVAYTRGVAGRGNFKNGVRWIRRTTSKDFRQWTPLESIDADGTPFEHLYTNACVPYERAPGMYLMFPARFVPEREPVPDWEYGPGVNDIVFMSSRDGITSIAALWRLLSVPDSMTATGMSAGFTWNGVFSKPRPKKSRYTVWQTGGCRLFIFVDSRSERMGLCRSAQGTSGVSLSPVR